VLVVRTFAQSPRRAAGQFAPQLHVINALTDEQHPCQALADAMRMRQQWGDCRGKRVAFVGDGNNVATSLAHVTSMLGHHAPCRIAEGFDLPMASSPGRDTWRSMRAVVRFRDPRQAVAGVDAVYTDVWASMGQEKRAARRASRSSAVPGGRRADVRRRQPRDVHALPAGTPRRRGTAEVFESPASVVFDQAENRLHAQKALLLTLLANGRQ
jgi:ornithine carbamoyltransferase